MPYQTLLTRSRWLHSLGCHYARYHRYGDDFAVKKCSRYFRKAIGALLNQVLDKAEKYRALPEAGRTHAQHAVPITLGYKFAIWADELGRETYFAGNFGGTAGTLASLFDKGIAVRNDF